MAIQPASVKVDAAFNRYTIAYSSSLPLRASVGYTLGGKSVTETCYLDAGESMSFSSYIDAFLDGETADAGTLTVSFAPITMLGQPTAEDDPAFRLTGLATETAQVPAKETYFFENERYRVGVELAWGGGLSYILDKKCTVPGLGNLLNHCDTGRLIQQSYYGTGKPPYVLGEFMGNRWVYNPVQGGDRGGFKSKLIDFSVTENAVWIKCRPRDWGHCGGDTYSYMENTYTLEGDYVRVDNRFTDYSGWEHPCNTQELPAFYTVSYLGHFRIYEGKEPWTDAPLADHNDLPFWPTDWNKCTFFFRQDNTERWAAFTDDGGYGLGLFVPNTNRWLAGRNAFDASMDPRAQSCNYIAPTRAIKLVCFKPLTYSYLLTAGQLEDIRAAFKARKDDITNQSLVDY